MGSCQSKKKSAAATATTQQKIKAKQQQYKDQLKRRPSYHSDSGSVVSGGSSGRSSGRSSGSKKKKHYKTLADDGPMEAFDLIEESYRMQQMQMADSTDDYGGESIAEMSPTPQKTIVDTSSSPPAPSLPTTKVPVLVKPKGDSPTKKKPTTASGSDSSSLYSSSDEDDENNDDEVSKSAPNAQQNDVLARLQAMMAGGGGGVPITETPNMAVAASEPVPAPREASDPNTNVDSSSSPTPNVQQNDMLKRLQAMMTGGMMTATPQAPIMNSPPVQASVAEVSSSEESDSEFSDENDNDEHTTDDDAIGAGVNLLDDDNDEDFEVDDKPKLLMSKLSPILFSSLEEDSEIYQHARKLRKRIHFDPYSDDDVNDFDEQDVRNFLESLHPERACDVLRVKFDFDFFSGSLFALNVICALRASQDVVWTCLNIYPDAIAACDPWVGTPLHYACSHRAPLETVELLIQQSPQSMFKTNQFGRTPLHMACLFQSQNVEVIHLLLQHDVENSCAALPDKDGYLALHFACENGAPVRVAQLLLEAHPGAASATTSHEGRTPLHFACIAGDEDLISLLLGADESQLLEMDLLGQTPLHAAVEHHANLEVIQMLVDAGGISVLDFISDRGETPLRVAQRVGCEDALILGLLSSAGM